MRQAEIAALINGFEAEHPVEDWTVGDLHVWPLVRLRLMLALGQPGAPAVAPAPLPAALEGLGLGLRRRLADAAHEADDRARADAVFLSDGVSFTRLGGAWYEKFCDPLIDALAAHGRRSLLLTPQSRYWVPRHTPSRFIQPALDARKALAALDRKLGRAPETQLPGFEALAAHLGPHAALAPTRAQLLLQVALIRRYAAYYRRILERTRPAVGAVVSYYGNVQMAFLLACRELGIPSIDLQHGVEGELHLAYGRWHKLPPTGYAVLPAIFWVWSEEEARAIAAWSEPLAPWHRPLVGGNVLLQRWTRIAGAEAAAPVRARKARLGAGPHLLVTLQGFEAPEAVIALMRAVGDRRPGAVWWLRCHPGRPEQRAAIARAITEAGLVAELDAATDVPLYSLLPEVDLHLTHFSSTVIEAAQLGLPSVVLHPYAVELFPSHVASGIACYAETPEAAAEAVERQLAARRDRPADPSEQGVEALLRLVARTSPTVV